MDNSYFVGRCTSKVGPHGTETEVSFIESTTEYVAPVLGDVAPLHGPTGPKGPTGGMHAAPMGLQRELDSQTGHETFVVDRHNQAHFVEVSDFFPQNMP